MFNHNNVDFHIMSARQRYWLTKLPWIRYKDYSSSTHSDYWQNVFTKKIYIFQREIELKGDKS